jgi:hypothetical protein
MMPSYGRQRWTAWTAKHGDPTAAFLRLGAELGVVTIDGPAVSPTPTVCGSAPRPPSRP